MNTTPHVRRESPVVSLITGAVPESAVQHVRNALQLLTFMEAQNPTTWAMVPELGRAQRRARAAVVLLEVEAHFPPTRHAADHIRGAVQAILDADVQWDVLTEIRAACARLLQALFLTETM